MGRIPQLRGRVADQVPEDGLRHFVADADNRIPAQIPARPHPLPWTNAPTGVSHLVTDANGEIVYCGPDSAQLVRLYNAAQELADKEPRGE